MKYQCPVCDGETDVKGRECIFCRDAKLSELQLNSIGYQVEQHKRAKGVIDSSDHRGTGREITKMRQERRGEIRKLRGVRSHGR